MVFSSQDGKEIDHVHCTQLQKIMKQGWVPNSKKYQDCLGDGNYGYEFLGVGEMFEGDSVDMCAEKFSLIQILN